MLIFDCNGVLVDSEAIAATVASQELTRAGFKISPEIVSRFFAGRRPSDMIADVELATKRKLPSDFYDKLTDATMRRLRTELRSTPHMEYALTWLRGPKCVCSSSPHTRVRMSLERTDPLQVLRTLRVLGERRRKRKAFARSVSPRRAQDGR